MKVIDKINLSGFLTGMSRGVVVLDENLIVLKDSLRDEHIKVIIPERFLTDDAIKHQLLSHRILITNNSADFVEDATAIEYGIIATENIKFKDNLKLSKMISKAIVKFDLWSHQSGFILTLQSDGKHDFKVLPR
jgi:hypothetical protein